MRRRHPTNGHLHHTDEMHISSPHCRRPPPLSSSTIYPIITMRRTHIRTESWQCLRVRWRYCLGTCSGVCGKCNAWKRKKGTLGSCFSITSIAASWKIWSSYTFPRRFGGVAVPYRSTCEDGSVRSGSTGEVSGIEKPSH